MQFVMNKTLNCPFCLRPLGEDGYHDHVSTCSHDHTELHDRLKKYAGILVNDYASLISEYKQMIQYDDSFFPPHWESDDTHVNTTFHVIEATSPEAKSVLDAVDGCRSIKRIERIQNKELYLQYQNYKNQRQGIERLLFHGSSLNKYNLICNQGFDLGHSNNGLHSYGIYLSSTMSYSVDYVKNTSGHTDHQILLCRAWVSHETTIADNIHVFHRDYAVYPAYILYY